MACVLKYVVASKWDEGIIQACIENTGHQSQMMISDNAIKGTKSSLKSVYVSYVIDNYQKPIFF